MRTLTTISSDSDIYQPVPLEDIEMVEAELKAILPIELKDIYLHPQPERIETLTTLLWPVHHNGVGIIDKNIQLRSRDYDPFPVNLIAFATNNCGDFWVIDMNDMSITYIDPDKDIKENLASDDLLRFSSFQEWEAFKISKE